jgi:hypothetical protein
VSRHPTSDSYTTHGHGAQPDGARRPGRARVPRDDAGGVWIVTGVVLGVLMYGFVVLMDVAGFTEVLPLVVLPPVVLGLIAANNLLGGGRGYGRGSARPVGPDRATSAGGPDGAGSGTDTGSAHGAGSASGVGSAGGRHIAGEPRSPR